MRDAVIPFKLIELPEKIEAMKEKQKKKIADLRSTSQSRIRLQARKKKNFFKNCSFCP